MLAWSSICVNERRPENAPAYASEFAEQVAGDEPVHLHCRVDGGYGVDDLLVATDRRLIYAAPVPGGKSREVVWTVSYCESPR